jgi:hypothetical protein
MPAIVNWAATTAATIFARHQGADTTIVNVSPRRDPAETAALPERQ